MDEDAHGTDGANLTLIVSVELVLRREFGLPEATDSEIGSMIDRVRQDQRSAWAKSMPEFGPGTQIHEGPEARAAITKILGDAPNDDA